MQWSSGGWLMADDHRIRRSGRSRIQATTGILPLVASLARGTVLRCLYGVLCYSVYVAIFLYVDTAYRVSPCSLWENRRKQTRLSSHRSLCPSDLSFLSLFLFLCPSVHPSPFSQANRVPDFQKFSFDRGRMKELFHPRARSDQVLETIHLQLLIRPVERWSKKSA